MEKSASATPDWCPFRNADCAGRSRCGFALCDMLFAAGRWLLDHEYGAVTIRRDAEAVRIEKTVRERIVIERPRSAKT